PTRMEPSRRTAPERQTEPDVSFAERTRRARKARANEKILREKSFGELAIERIRHSQSVLYGFLDEAGRLFSFIGQFFSRFWRRPFEARELANQMDEVG